MMGGDVVRFAEQQNRLRAGAGEHAAGVEFALARGDPAAGRYALGGKRGLQQGGEDEAEAYQACHRG